MHETKSNWDIVAQKIKQAEPIVFAEHRAYQMHLAPHEVLNALSYYKFAAKMIGANKNVLDIGCQDGMGTYLLGKECGFAYGIDQDQNMIKEAKKRFSEGCVDFSSHIPQGKFYAIIALFDCTDLTSILSLLEDYGIFILGNSKFELTKQVERYFKHQFIFSATNEVVQAGFIADAHYYLTLYSGKE